MTDTAKDVKTFPAPEALATPTDLTSEGVQKITDAMNPIIADALALYVKTKNYHWHVSGARFRDLHKLLDTQAEAILKSTDPMAERVRKIGGTTVRSVSHISEMQSIDDSNEDFVDPDTMLRHLMEDNKHITHLMRDTHDVCDENGDYATASILEDLIDLSERRTWFLYEFLQDTDRFD